MASIRPAAREARGLSPDEAKAIAMDAYVYGYSLITTEVTRVQMTNVPGIEGLHMPMGTFLNVRRYPPADFRGVSAPNADTLYSMAWLDLGEEPWVFSHPDMGGRFFMFPMYSLWMEVIESPGARTTGGRAARYLISGPEWSGEAPEGMKRIVSPTRYMVILGRTYADGTEADYRAVNALQDQYDLRPLSAARAGWTWQAPPVNPDPGFSMTDKPQQAILGLSTERYFGMMAELMGRAAPPPQEDAPILGEMAKLGIAPGEPFAMDRLDPPIQAALRDIPQEALKKIEANRNTLGQRINGWIVSKGLGRYGADYLKRATVAAFGWPANLEEDAVYPYTEVDSAGAKLNGANRYTLTFPRGMTPPVRGFWSITMYEIDQGWWFTPNPLNRFTVSPRNDPRPNDDGSLTLYFQNESPGRDLEANWLPAPKGDFLLMLRIYWPDPDDPSILNGAWRPPEVRRVD